MASGPEHVTSNGLRVVEDAISLRGRDGKLINLTMFRLRDPGDARQAITESAKDAEPGAASVEAAAGVGDGAAAAGDDSDDDTEYSEVIEEVGRELWAYVWGTAPFFAEVLLWVGLEGETVTEIGGGVCLPGIVACLAGASRVVCTDYMDAGFPVAELTAEANGVSASMSFQTLNWEEAVSDDFPRASLVIGTDVLYLPESGLHILRTVKDLLLPGGTCLIGDPGRAAADHFIDVCRRDADIMAYCHDLHTPATDDASPQHMRVFELYKPRAGERPPTSDGDGAGDKGTGDAPIPSRIHKAVLEVFHHRREHRDQHPFSVTVFGT